MPGFGAGLRLLAVVGLFLSVLWALPFRAEIGAQEKAVDPGPARMALPVASGQIATVSAISLEHDNRQWIATVAPPRQSYLKPDPQTLCDLMADGGAVMSWTRSAFFQGEWECLKESAAAPGADGPARGDAIFAMARGRDAQTIETIRLKLSLGEDGAGDEDHARLLEIADAVMGGAGRTLPEAIKASLKNLEPGRASAEGVDIVFEPERMFPGRYNLIIRFRSPGG